MLKHVPQISLANDCIFIVKNPSLTWKKHFTQATLQIVHPGGDTAIERSSFACMDNIFVDELAISEHHTPVLLFTNRRREQRLLEMRVQESLDNVESRQWSNVE